MKATEIEEYATKLLSAHGDKAEAEAAEKARDCDEKGLAEEAADWRRIRAAIASKRGPHAS